MISFVIPALNESATIARCIESIKACPFQHEIIVVDNGSTDDTGDVALRAGAKIYNEPRKGVTQARETGWLVAKYDLIAFIDADSSIPPEWFALAITEMADPRVVAASGPVLYEGIGVLAKIAILLFFVATKLVSLIFPVAIATNLICKRSALNQVGGWNTEIEFYGDDTDMARRLSKVGRVKFCFDLFTFASARRMHAEGLIMTGARYVLNFIWVHARGRPWSHKHNDVRTG